MLITGASQRIGAYIAQSAHADGYNIVLHYRQSVVQTQALKEQLNKIRTNSCISVKADFNNETDFKNIIDIISTEFDRLDVLVNNASEFFSTNLSELRPLDYDKLFNSNVKGPLFLSKACYHLLKKVNGSIINLVDIHADKPLKGYPVYSMAKAANKMMVQALAKEYAPEIRVNGISPGCIIWPAGDLTDKEKHNIIKRTVLEKRGNEKNIYQAIQFLIENDYITGQIINVDGGRSLHM
ncbi:MAG: pteridine reductase [Alcanivoracaceae bacterium]|nr:pteridine reductase [Alcanivoracaceae bacterium]